MPTRAKGDKKWKNRRKGQVALADLTKGRVPLPANEQQRLEEFFTTLHALVYWRLALRELVKGRDLSSGKEVSAAEAEDARHQLERFDAELFAASEELEGQSLLATVAQRIKQHLVTFDVRLFEVLLTLEQEDKRRLERDLETMPGITYHLTRDVDRIRAALKADNVRSAMARRPRPAVQEAATLAASHLWHGTMGERTIETAKAKTKKGEEAAGLEPLGPRLERTVEITLNGEVPKHIEWGDLIAEARRKKK